MKQPIGTGEIARELGVSRATVSKALSEEPDISAAMKERVGDKYRELNLRPNLAARMPTGPFIWIWYLITRASTACR